MRKIEHRVDVKQGKMIADNHTIRDLISTLEDGKYVLTIEKEQKPKSVAEFQKYYFYLRDKLHNGGGTGYSENELHTLIKKYVFQKLPIDSKYFNIADVDPAEIQNPDKWSVKWLTLAGWELYIKHMKGMAWEHFNCYL